MDIATDGNVCTLYARPFVNTGIIVASKVPTCSRSPVPGCTIGEIVKLFEGGILAQWNVVCIQCLVTSERLCGREISSEQVALKIKTHRNPPNTEVAAGLNPYTSNARKKISTFSNMIVKGECNESLHNLHSLSNPLQRHTGQSIVPLPHTVDYQMFIQCLVRCLKLCASFIIFQRVAW